ncbi:MAG TPA: hypothetical protein VGP99_03985, partial [Tepidisphaeraceae bacterium]|nr:hypothetical protein [Tepidisphaeraceae bacterium]
TAARLSAEIQVSEDEKTIRISTPELSAAVNKKGYVSGIAGGSFLDKKSGFHDPGFGLDIVDWVMEAGSDESYRDQLNTELVYKFNNLVHGKTAKRCIEGPQICSRAKEVDAKTIKGSDFLVIKQEFQYRTAAPGRKTGSKWEQTIVFPPGQRYFISSDRMHVVNSSDTMFFRIDMPGHIKHNKGDTFREIYLSYLGKIPSSEFGSDFAPDEKFNYRRDKNKAPERFIRAYHLRDPKSGKEGPWLAGMTLDPQSVYEAWCHQRGYISFIEEIGGRPIKAGESFGAAFIVGYFDSIEEMEKTYDQYKGATQLEADATGWKLK